MLCTSPPPNRLVCDVVLLKGVCDVSGDGDDVTLSSMSKVIHTIATLILALCRYSIRVPRKPIRANWKRRDNSQDPSEKKDMIFFYRYFVCGVCQASYTFPLRITCKKGEGGPEIM